MIGSANLRDLDSTLTDMPVAVHWTLVRRAALLFLIALCLGVGLAAPAMGHETFVDEIINRETVSYMRAGAGYYPAMDRALLANASTPSTVRAFREPTVFLLWRVLPSQEWVWWSFVAVVGLTCLLLLTATSAPAVVPVIAAYLLFNGRPHSNGWSDQYLIVELWGVLPVAGLLAARTRGKDGLAAACATTATLVRELAAGLVVGGLAAAAIGRRRLRPWLAAIGVLGGAGVAHVLLTTPYLSPHGNEAPLLGTGGLDRLASMASVGLPIPGVAVAVLWLLAIGRLAAEPDLAVAVAPFIALPLTGLFIGRDYWGFLVIPFVVMWAAEAAAVLIRRMTPARYLARA